MKKNFNLIAISAILIAVGSVVEEFLLPYKFSFLTLMGIALVLLTFVFIGSVICEFSKTKDRKFFGGGLILGAIFLKDTWTTLIKILHQ
ncbi:MAG: hypothetical protein WCP39_01345 [Chlamydiota bacterium]